MSERVSEQKRVKSFSEKDAKEKPCLCCGDMTKGWIAEEWEMWKDDYKPEQFFVENPEVPLTDMDIVGYPICEDCYKKEFEE